MLEYGIPNRLTGFVSCQRSSSSGISHRCCRFLIQNLLYITSYVRLILLLRISGRTLFLPLLRSGCSSSMIVLRLVNHCLLIHHLFFHRRMFLRLCFFTS
jgi:hypothetical protein